MNKCCVVLVVLLAGIRMLAQTPAANAPAFDYKPDYGAIKQVGRDLLDQLKPKFRSQLSPSPVWIADDVWPYSRPMQFVSENVPTRVVKISKGFVFLAANVAHAKAIDRIEPGFFDRYTDNLSQQTEKIVPTLQEFSDPRYWTEEVMNEQSGYFNQIIGAVAAIDLAHQYLSHYDKYSDLLQDSAINPQTMALNCSAQEWDMALKLGVANSLDCGFGFEGYKSFLNCIAHMSKRPGWTYYFLPRTANLDKILKDLDKIENRFFGTQ